jgi:hypothetical protein
MSITVKVEKRFNALGKSYDTDKTIVAEASLVIDSTHGKAFAGVLSTRTNNTDGSMTMVDPLGPPGVVHGIQLNLLNADIYWVGGSRTGVSITWGANPVAITGGTGDNLPVQGTAVVVNYQHVFRGFTATFGAGVFPKALLIGCTGGPSRFQLVSDLGAILLDKKVEAGAFYEWYEDSGIPFPFSTAAVLNTIKLSHGDETAVRDVKFVYAFDTIWSS